MGRPALTIKGLYVTCNRKPGKPVRWYVYAWRGGPCIMTKVGGTRPALGPEETAAYHAAVDEHRRPDPHTLRALVAEWRSSPEWNALAPGTRKTWGSPLNLIEDKWGETPLAIWSDPRMVAKVMHWRDSRAETPRAADIGVTVLREMLKFGRLRARVSINVAAEIPTLYRGGDRAEIVWTAEDMDRFAWEAVRQDQAHVADGMWLAACTGMRRADLVSVRRAQVYEYAIIKKALKKSRGKRRTATMPRIPELDSLIEELEGRPRAEGVETVLVNSFGQPWSGDGYGGSFNRIRDKAGIAHVDEETGEERRKHLHDLRGTFCTKLILAGLTDQEAADVMGWSPERVGRIRRVYVDQSRVVVAIGERIATGTVNRIVNRSEADTEK